MNFCRNLKRSDELLMILPSVLILILKVLLPLSYTDFSAANLAAVLCQVQERKERLIAACAQKCNIAQANYGSTKGKLCAIVMGLKKFEPILRCKKFVIRTDIKGLLDVTKMKTMMGVHYQWLMFIQSFHFEIEHISGPKNVLADSISQMRDVPSPSLEEEYDILNQNVKDIYLVEERDLQLEETKDSS